MKALKVIFGGIAKVVGYLMGTLGLWFPALFTVVFFITCFATDTALSNKIMAIYYCGLGFTAVGGLALAMYLHNRQKRKNASAPMTAPPPEREEKAAKSRKKNKRETGREEPVPPPYANGTYAPYPPQYAPPSGGYMQDGYFPRYDYGEPPIPQQMAYAQQTQQPQRQYREKEYAQPVRRADVSDLERKYFSESANTVAREETRYGRTVTPDAPTVPTSYGRTGDRDGQSATAAYGRTVSRDEQTSSSYALGAEELWRRLSGADVPDEQPLLFRTRKDPDVYVYEYSDRYQYWRRTKTGMVLERTEYKNADVRLKK